MKGYYKGIEWDCYKLAADTSKEAVMKKKGEAEQNSFISQRHNRIIHLLDDRIENAKRTNNEKEIKELKTEKIERIKAYEKIRDGERRRKYDEERVKSNQKKEEELREQSRQRKEQERFEEKQKKNRKKIEKSEQNFKLFLETLKGKVEAPNQKEIEEYYEFETRQRGEITVEDARHNFQRKYHYIPQMSRTAYGILNVLPPTLEENIGEQYDQKVEKNYKKLKEQILLEIENLDAGIEQLEEILDRMKKLDSNYEKIKDFEARQKYEPYMKYRKEKSERRQQVEDKYYHKDECDFNLIKNEKKQDHSIEGKAVIRADKEGEEYTFKTDENRNLKIQPMGLIGYSTKDGLQIIYQYKVKREIGGEELTNICFSTESITEVLFDKRGGGPYDKKRLQCIINQLFSEELIEGSEYNNGFIAGIEKDENGNYSPTLGKRELSRKDKAALTALIILEEKEKKKENNNRDEK